jgi:hypothetical protein
MLVCGVDIGGSAAVVALVKKLPNSIEHVPCAIKRLVLDDDKDTQSLVNLKSAIEAFARQHKISEFVIKSRLARGKLASGGITFKIETLFQLSATPVSFVSPITLSKFSKTNMGGVPASVVGYQTDAYRVGACWISKG